MKETKYDGMGIFREAKQRSIDGMGYRARRFKIVWQSKKVSWNWIAIEYGIRWSDHWQLFPIWNVSDNCGRKLLFGFWKLYFEIIYQRARNSHYLQNLPFFNIFRRFYLLLF